MDMTKKTVLLRLLLGSLLLGSLSACHYMAYTNQAIDLEAINLKESQSFSKASFTLHKDRGNAKKTLFVMALSGGGSRAAYWSAAAMKRMETLYDVNLLEEVDAISAISGGSMAAAYYAVSADSDQDEYFTKASNEQPLRGNRPLWTKKAIRKVMSKNFLARWFGNWFWPHNILGYWFTAFDRTDIMAKTLSDNLFDTSRGQDFKFKQLNPNRPNIILNSTISSSKGFSGSLSFTQEDFQNKLCSDINDYKVSRAVMSSAAFPAAFNAMTLRDFHIKDAENCDKVATETSKNPAYLHLIDGGSHDNLGLRSALRFLHENEKEYEQIAVLLLDAYTPPMGLSVDRANPRNLFDYFIDSNVMDSVNVLMDRNREEVISEMIDYLSKAEENRGKSVQFYHATFENIRQGKQKRHAQKDKEAALNADPNAEPVLPLRQRLFNVPTSLKIGNKGLDAIDEAVDRLFIWENPCLQKITQMISGIKMPEADKIVDDVYCNWTN